MLTTEFFQKAMGDRAPRCNAGCGRFIKNGQRVLVLVIKDPAVPYDQRRQYSHASCAYTILGDPVPDDFEDDIDEVIAGVRELIQDFAG